MSLNFPHFGIEDEFDWSRVGYAGPRDTNDTPYFGDMFRATQDIMNYDSEATYSFSVSAGGTSISKDLTASDLGKWETPTKSSFQNRFMKGLYILDVNGYIATNATVKNTASDSRFDDYYAYIELRLPHSNISNYTDSFGWRYANQLVPFENNLAYDAAKTENAIYLDAGESYKMPGIPIKCKHLVFIDPDNIKEDLSGTIGVSFPFGFAAAGTIKAKTHIALTFSIVYNMDYDGEKAGTIGYSIPKIYPYQFWKESD